MIKYGVDLKFNKRDIVLGFNIYLNNFKMNIKILRLLVFRGENNG